MIALRTNGVIAVVAGTWPGSNGRKGKASEIILLCVLIYCVIRSSLLGENMTGREFPVIFCWPVDWMDIYLAYNNSEISIWFVLVKLDLYWFIFLGELVL